MAPRSCLCLICGCLFWSIHGIIPEPQNIRFHSVMFDTVLQWDSPNFYEGNITYTVQYKDFTSKFINLCQRTYFTMCNISSIPSTVLSQLRIRSEFDNKQSNWVNTSFTPLKDTNIIPPTVQIAPIKPGALNVHLISPSLILHGMRFSLSDLYVPLVYKMKIWPEDYVEQVRDENTSSASHVISGLDPGRAYCLKAQAYIQQVNKSGEWSEAYCSQTADSGTDPVTITVIILILLLSIFVCCVVIVCNYQRIKHIFLPSYSLPQHVLEFLSQSSYTSQFLASQFQEDHNHETITVLSEVSK